MSYYIVMLLISFLVTFIFTILLIPRLKRFNIVGQDINKPKKPIVPEMGGIAIVAGFTAGILFAVFANSFLGFEMNLPYILAALITIHSIAFIGIVDDLLNIPQWLKAILPLFAATPLVAAKVAGSTFIVIPFLGAVDFGMYYIFILIPIGVAVASNLTNMLAGFNSLEAGMGIVIFSFTSLFALATANVNALVIFIPILGALLGFILHNRYPAKIFPGDSGNLTIGAALAAGVIIGNIEAIGSLFLSLYVVDFFIKASKGFPSKNWEGEYRDGKLYPVKGEVRSLCQLIMKKTNGINEITLVSLLIAAQIVICSIVVLFYLGVIKT